MNTILYYVIVTVGAFSLTNKIFKLIDLIEGEK